VGDDNSCPHLNTADGERALLIKDNVGDWGIVHGKWLGFRKGVPGTPGKVYGVSVISPFTANTII